MHIVGVQPNVTSFLALACFIEADSELSDPLELIPGLRFLHLRHTLLEHLSEAQLSKQHSVATEVTLLSITLSCGNIKCHL